MKIPLDWINELINTKEVKLNDLIDKLTLGGFEVEEILELKINKKKKIILNISGTANRADSLSVQGISSEISSLLNHSSKTNLYTLNNLNWKFVIENLNNFSQLNYNCPTFLAVKIENLKSQKIPKWLDTKLLSSGIKPSNTYRAFTDYVLLEMGYPFLIYDLDKIRCSLNVTNYQLSVSKSKKQQEFLASNDVIYNLDDSVLTVNVNDRLMSIAGLIETKQFACSKRTQTLLIEGSLFNPKLIRQQTRKLGLRTDRSARYEKSLQQTHLITALYRLISLLRISNPNLTCKLMTFCKAEDQIINPVKLRYQKIKETLGPIKSKMSSNRNYLTMLKIQDYLDRLNFYSIYNEAQQFWNIKIPQTRMADLLREIDLIEEVGRLHGFSNFLTILPKMRSIGTENNHYKIRKKITESLLKLGFNELINYSLVTQNASFSNRVEILNPLLVDYSSLRTSLLPNLINAVQLNVKQKNLYLDGFEYGHVFQKTTKNSFEEKEYIAGIFGGERIKSSWTDTSCELNWFKAKGKIEQIFNQLNLVTFWEMYHLQDVDTVFHPYRSANIYLENGYKLGSFGQIHPFLASELNLVQNLYCFEFNVERIQFYSQNKKLFIYKDYAIYPKILKDLSFIVPNDISFASIQKVLFANGTKFLAEIVLLDEYRNESILENSLSLCLQLVFQSTKTTLENKKIDSIVNKLKTILTRKFNATIRL